MARLKDAYNERIRGQLIEKFGYSSSMQAPKLTKITVNMGVGEAKQDTKMLDAARELRDGGFMRIVSLAPEVL